MAFTKSFMNQAGALVHLYLDGTVLLTHAGHEMGQGLHTKVAQVCAAALGGLPLSAIHVSETSTDKVANTQPTAASVGSDLNGFAVANACEQLMGRLKPYIEAEIALALPPWPALRAAASPELEGSVCAPDAVAPGSGGRSSGTEFVDDSRDKLYHECFTKALQKAHFQAVNLSAQGFYSTPSLDYSYATNTGRAYHYWAFGVACSEVEVDCLTGDFTVLRTDILHDVGSSLNPAVDIGQVEGGFIQGMALFTQEEVVWTRKKLLPANTVHSSQSQTSTSPMYFTSLFTRGPSTYKIPTAGDIPIDFRVKLLEDSDSDSILNTSTNATKAAPLCASTSSAPHYAQCKEASSRLTPDRNDVIPREVSVDKTQPPYTSPFTAASVMGSKGVGEPPLFLGATVYFAIKEAIYSHRQQWVNRCLQTAVNSKDGSGDSGPEGSDKRINTTESETRLEDRANELPVSDIEVSQEEFLSWGSRYFRLDSPATAERIRNACWNEFNALSPTISRVTTNDTTSHQCVTPCGYLKVPFKPKDLDVYHRTTEWHPCV
eukprot:GHVQ01013332.1.p1 GENE.GHVQ01013332.1~~GHVQ01013332.1.p1  ORF type:complete len:556 (+),score=76.35 GHVQ01013332.1:31-1668(+)